MSEAQKKIFGMLMESQYWPPEQMLAFQRSQLMQLLRHARRNVPFYKNRLNPVFNKNDEIDWDRWHEIPIVSRADLRDRSDEMLALHLPSGHGKVSRGFTSGSTGIPISFRKNKLFVIVSRAANWRFSKWVGWGWLKTNADFPPNFDESRANQEGFYLSSRGPPWLEGSRGTSIVLSRGNKEADHLALLRRFNVQSISSTPNYVEILAHENLTLPAPLRIETIINYGMHTLDYQRVLFKQSFGAETFSLYSADEVGHIAAQCEMQNAYHINSEHMLVEITDEHGMACLPGVPGRVVITSFFSTSQPLIRYNLGDIAEFGGACPCGRNLPTISRIVGRQDPVFTRPDGKGFWPVFKHEAIATGLQCKSYQIAQVEPLVFEVRYIPHSLGSPRNLSVVREHIAGGIPFAVTVVFREMDSIPLGAGAKQQRLVREVQWDPT